MPIYQEHGVLGLIKVSSSTLGSRHRRERNRRFLGDYIRGKHCEDCGYDDWRILEFDHLPQYEKYKEINVLVSGGYSIDTIKEEIKKCAIVCPNCHRHRTLQRQKNWRTEYYETEY